MAFYALALEIPVQTRKYTKTPLAQAKQVECFARALEMHTLSSNQDKDSLRHPSCCQDPWPPLCLVLKHFFPKWVNHLFKPWC